MMGRKKSDPVARFNTKVRETEDCWLWTAGTDKDGYGKFWINGETVRAHRVSWEFCYGPIPEGMDVLHHCDNPPCIRPEHLYLGSDTENMADRDKRGRTATGDRCGARTHPESLARGDANGMRKHPEKSYWGRVPPERKARGERIARAVLTEDIVRSIRADRLAGKTFRSIASSLGVGLSAVKAVGAGRTWKHVQTLDNTQEKTACDN